MPQVPTLLTAAAIMVALESSARGCSAETPADAPELAAGRPECVVVAL